MIELRIKILGEILWIRKPTKIGLWGASLLPRSSAGGPESESLVVGNCFEHCFWNTITSADCCKVEPAMATRWRSLVESPWREVNTKSEVQELFTATNWTKPPRGYSRVCTAFPLLVSYTTAHPRSVPPTRSPPFDKHSMLGKANNGAFTLKLTNKLQGIKFVHSKISASASYKTVLRVQTNGCPWMQSWAWAAMHYG